MFYIGYTDINTARILYALSKNEINNWKRGPKPIVIPTKEKFDNNACYKPSAIFDKNKNRWILWYNGRNYNKEFIGVTMHSNKKILYFLIFV